MLLGLKVEGYGAEEVAMVGDGGRRKAEINGPGAQVFEANGAVKKAVLGMAMQMGETAHGALGGNGIFGSGK